MRTTERQRLRWEDALMRGRKPSVQECIDLVHDASEAERLEEQLEGLKAALEDAGMKLIDTTTDEDAGTVMEIIALEEP